MWNSRDLTLIIIFGALGTVYTFVVTQIVNMISGVTGATFLFVIGYAIFVGTQLLLFNGRRWNFFVSTLLFVALTLPTSFAGAPFDIVSRIPVITNAFVFDFVFNSAYGYFKKKNKLLLMTILFSIGYHLINPITGLMYNHLFYPPEYIVAFANAIMIMSPVIITESIAGGYISHKIYQRVVTVQNWPQN